MEFMEPIWSDYQDFHGNFQWKSCPPLPGGEEKWTAEGPNKTADVVLQQCVVTTGVPMVGSEEVRTGGCSGGGGSAHETSNSPNSTVTMDDTPPNFILGEYEKFFIDAMPSNEPGNGHYLLPQCEVFTELEHDHNFPLPQSISMLNYEADDSNSCGSSDAPRLDWDGAPRCDSNPGWAGGEEEDLVTLESNREQILQDMPSDQSGSSLEDFLVLKTTMYENECVMMGDLPPPLMKPLEPVREEVCQEPVYAQPLMAATAEVQEMGVMIDTNRNRNEVGMELVHQLFACAQTLTWGDLVAARQHAHRLEELASPTGTPMERVATYFTTGLVIRMEDYQKGLPPGLEHQHGRLIGGQRPHAIGAGQRAYGSGCGGQYGGGMGRRSLDPGPVDWDATAFAYHEYYTSCPYLMVSHFVATQAILEAFDGEEKKHKLHIVDLDIKRGMQWPSLILELSRRSVPCPPQLRITAVVGADPYMDDVLKTQARLLKFADQYKVALSYEFVEQDVGDLQESMLNIDKDDDEEVLAVNCVCSLHPLVHHRSTSVESFLSMIRGLNPALVTVVEEDALHGADDFLERFSNAVHYYSSMFDSVAGGSLGVEKEQQKMKRNFVERFFLGPDIINIVAKEGLQRHTRHLPALYWTERMENAGFRNKPASEDALLYAGGLLAKFMGDKYRLMIDSSESRYLALGWEDSSLYFISSWGC